MFSYRWLVGTFIVLFIALQSFSLSHATSFGEAPHDHDGIACELTVITSDEDLTLPVDTPQNTVQVFSFPENYNGFIPVSYTYLTLPTKA